jgi:hypothetical protein
MASSRCRYLRRRGFLAPTEFAFVHPHAMKDRRKLAGQRNFCPFHATPPCHIDCPPLQRREPGGAGQHDVGRLVKGGAHHSVTDPADATVQVRFAGLLLLRRQSEVRATPASHLNHWRFVNS